GVFWRPSHAALPGALLGLAGARRHPLRAAVLALPWALLARPHYGSSPRGLLRAAGELPGRLAIETAELAAAVRGSLRYRTWFLGTSASSARCTGPRSAAAPSASRVGSPMSSSRVATGSA